MAQHFPIPGTAPASLIHHEGRKKEPPKLRLMEYGPTHFEEKDPHGVAELPAPDAKAPMRWIEMNGLGDVESLRALGAKYGLHPLALEDTLNTGQRPKLDLYDDHGFLVAQMIYELPDGSICHEQVSMFLFKNLLITVQEEPDLDVFEPMRERLRAGRGYARKCLADYLAYALLDAIIDHTFPVLERMGDKIEAMEEEILEKPRPVCAHRIHHMKRVLMQMRRAVWPARDLVSSLLHDESGIITDNTKIFLRDCYDHTVQIMDLVESYRDVASGLMEMYLSAVGMRTNEIMRVLTVISAIFIPLTFVAGVYGMNFDYADGNKPLNMPELHWPHGYLGCIVIMAAIAIGQLIFFRRKGWL